MMLTEPINLLNIQTRGYITNHDSLDVALFDGTGKKIGSIVWVLNYTDKMSIYNDIRVIIVLPTDKNVAYIEAYENNEFIILKRRQKEAIYNDVIKHGKIKQEKVNNINKNCTCKPKVGNSFMFNITREGQMMLITNHCLDCKKLLTGKFSVSEFGKLLAEKGE